MHERVGRGGRWLPRIAQLVESIALAVADNRALLNECRENPVGNVRPQSEEPACLRSRQAHARHFRELRADPLHERVANAGIAALAAR